MIKVTDLEHTPEGPCRDLLTYLQEESEPIQAMEKEVFYSTILCYILGYNNITDVGIEGCISRIFTSFIRQVDLIKALGPGEEVDDG